MLMPTIAGAAALLPLACMCCFAPLQDPLAALVFDAPVMEEPVAAAAPAAPEAFAAAAQPSPLVSVEDMEQSKMSAAAAAVQAEADRAEAVAVAETKAAEAAADAIADAVAAMQDKSKKVVAAPTAAQLAKYAADATAKGEPLFTWPPEGVQVDATARVYYNRVMGPLPSNGQLQLKAGLNKWEQIELYDMQRCVTREVVVVLFKLCCDGVSCYGQV
jgi:hypothetical protein